MLWFKIASQQTSRGHFHHEFFGLILFGGTDTEPKKAVYRNAFEDAFNKESCLDDWAKVGSASCTREGLKDDQVRRTICDARPQDETNIPMEKLNEANYLSKFNLNVDGYQGRLLKVQCEKAADLLYITVPHTKEMIELLAKASSHG